MTEDKMVGWHHQLDGHEFEQAPGDGEGQGSLACCSPWSHSTPGLPVHHQILELGQTHVHQVDDATQPSHPLSSPSPPAFNLAQHQGVF